MTDNNSHASYRPTPINEIPLDSEGCARADLYVYLSLQKRFVLYIPQGDKVTAARIDAITKHSVPCFYLKESDKNAASVTAPANAAGPQNFEVLGLPGNKALAKVFEDLSENLEAPPLETIQKLEGMADEVLKTVAPDAASMKARFSQNMDYLWLMNDASAISTLATMFAAANGINSPKPLRDIVFASLVMDLPLAKLDQEHMDTYYKNPKALPADVLSKIQEHPFQSYQLAKKTLPHLSDATFELILTHHEKYNGEGYPRHLKSVQIFPLGQIYSCAVDVFERMKGAGATDTGTLASVVKSLISSKLEPHQQRHRKEVVQNVATFLGFSLNDAKDFAKGGTSAA